MKNKRKKNLMDTMLSQKLSPAISHPPFPFELNSVRPDTCWKRMAAKKCGRGGGAKARRRRPGMIRSEFVICAGKRDREVQVGGSTH